MDCPVCGEALIGSVAVVSKGLIQREITTNPAGSPTVELDQAKKYYAALDRATLVGFVCVAESTAERER